MGHQKGYKVPEVIKKKISDTLKKRPNRYWLGKKRNVHWLKGRKHSEESKKKISQTRRLRGVAKGDKSNFWKGGVTPLNKSIRSSFEYKLWREAVFCRDSWRCVWCKKRGGRLEADHIKRFSDFPELRFAIDNGRTLCRECHRKTDNFGKK